MFVRRTKGGGKLRPFSGRWSALAQKGNILLKSLAAASAVVVASTTLGAGSASAEVKSGPVGEKTPGIVRFDRTVHVKRYNRDDAVVKVRYKCEGVGVHLWASVKQGRKVNRYTPTDGRTSPPADIARAWYETPEDAVPTCDGKAHTFRYVVSRATEGTPDHPDAWQRLREGRAWAQFVIFAAPEGTDPGNQKTWKRDAFAGWVYVEKHSRHRHHGN